MEDAAKSENFQPEITWIKIIWIKTYKTIRGELTTKVVCVIVVVVFMTLTGIAVDKPEIDVPPNQHHPHEAQTNAFVSQRFNYSNSIVVAANTANVAADSSYNISIS